MPFHYKIFRTITSGLLIAMSAYLFHFALTMEEIDSKRKAIKQAQTQKTAKDSTWKVERQSS